MKHCKIELIALALAIATPLAATTSACAQDYPVRSIRIVLPFSPGGGTDLLARLLSKRFYEAFGQTAAVDNRPGAGGNLGADIVAKSAPDGYTLLMSASTLTINPSLYANLPYDAIKSFAPVTLVATTPLVVVVHPSLPAKSVKELIALAKSKPGQMHYGSAGKI